MRAILQRVLQASVTVQGNSIQGNTVQRETVGAIERGILALVGIQPQDTEKQADWLAEKMATLRIFPDADGKMNLSLMDIQGELLIVSQFTLYGDCQKGRRPSFTGAAPPGQAEPLYEMLLRSCRLLGIKTESGRFGADMQVTLINDGPVTFLLDTPAEIP
ncbi:MAG TPA: D-aminoacyl-tRNA deacylase [Gemmatales bacterium]|nr:D-aminoacyl-tRNA deacylase [Gemmatales bacterium]